MFSHVRVRHFKIAAVIAMFLLFASMFVHVGCTAEQIKDAADDVAYVTSPVPTTQPGHPGAGVEIGRGAAQGAAAGNPPLSLVYTGIAFLATAVSSWASHKVGKRNGNNLAVAATEKLNDALGAVYELADDIELFKDPATPFSDKTTQVLVGVGHIDVATPIEWSNTAGEIK